MSIDPSFAVPPAPAPWQVSYVQSSMGEIVENLMWRHLVVCGLYSVHRVPFHGSSSSSSLRPRRLECMLVRDGHLTHKLHMEIQPFQAKVTPSCSSLQRSLPTCAAASAARQGWKSGGGAGGCTLPKSWATLTTVSVFSMGEPLNLIGLGRQKKIEWCPYFIFWLPAGSIFMVMSSNSYNTCKNKLWSKYKTIWSFNNNTDKTLVKTECAPSRHLISVFGWSDKGFLFCDPQSERRI